MREHAAEVEGILPARTSLADYITLIKPGIVGLVTVAALTGIYIGGRGEYNLLLICWTLGGLGIATAGSALLNNYFDRDIDRLMERTSMRALALGKVSPGKALIAGIALVAISVAALAFKVNGTTALLTAGAAVGYVVLYGIVLKRRSSFANQVGGLAGALPPLIGYAAITGGVDGTAMILFAVVAVWQQPHALSLALKYRDDYAKASIPVIPVAKGVKATKVRIVLYTILLIPVSLLLFLTGVAGVAYLATAIVLGTIFLILGVRFLRSDRQCDMFLFFFSILYLTLLFTAMVVDMV
ncbi:MAG: protoheme IX farnesyltransferase [Deltaproteobacteria bacterium]|nr:protoheme IX farnesyltransferase [Deltaproteobacteria bacterium]